jgi:YfiH family protein
MRPFRTSDGIAAERPDGLQDAGFLVAFTERTGGVSNGPFATLNVDLRGGDDVAAARENRRRTVRALGVDAVACARQVHGAAIVAAGRDDAGRGFLDPARALGDADGIITDEPNVAIVVLAADCVAIALADPALGRLAVVHAGWRGTAAGIVDRAVAAFDEPARTLAAIGPAVCADHYEVGHDVVTAVGAATGDGAVVERRGSRPHLDLASTIERRLRVLGVRRIERSGSCTACEPARFFSHRRDGLTGRQALIAMRRP